MHTFYRITAYLLFIGVIHTALTPLFYPSMSPDALWFAGTGLALVFLGLLNIAAARSRGKGILNMAVAANLVGSIWSLLVVIALAEIQAWISMVIFGLVTMSSIFVRFRGKTRWIDR